MVQQMIEKFNEYRLAKIGTDMATGDKQQPISAKKTALRDLRNDSKNNIPRPQGSSPLPAGKGLLSDSMKVSGTKRQQPCCPSSPARAQTQGANSSNGHLVYVRRKFETESGKMDASDSPAVKKSCCDHTSASKLQEANPYFPLVTTAPPPYLNPSSDALISALGLRKPSSILPIPAPKYSQGGSMISVQAEPQRIPVSVPVQPDPQRVPMGVPSQPETEKVPTGIPTQTEPQLVFTRVSPQFEPQNQRDQQWKERFIRLQMFLKSCDESSQEEYIQKLRSLSSAGRSRQAYELEKRAIELSLEERKEWQRIKALNVLGKSSTDGTQIPSPVDIAREEQSCSECH